MCALSREPSVLLPPHAHTHTRTHTSYKHKHHVVTVSITSPTHSAAMEEGKEHSYLKKQTNKPMITVVSSYHLTPLRMPSTSHWRLWLYLYEVCVCVCICVPVVPAFSHFCNYLRYGLLKKDGGAQQPDKSNITIPLIISLSTSFRSHAHTHRRIHTRPSATLKVAVNIWVTGRTKREDKSSY
ncbi:hypothetical protein, unlikely [Trypanosoma brucei gambiense DAL972]|uniref:Uncharacterized protein n=1 Tax=Trypanosoma brucei gambiense (strain MHOM/CI/86/DAL972) TaxID=679716 RepID=D0A235_TRYB9|nr:hypothetical protein, unlikely [Trypanosoma brucei gambiense DAL972]CBH15328.1 hypothetical protein, unlikely [Trypanosoma brucei gambiense DAL972]|eukprot:XP_011777593.1 hypothetical protein, unlikely [Trypanosoma brucei gambiense DAL972]